MSTPPSPIGNISQDLASLSEVETKRLGQFLATGALYTSFVISEDVRTLLQNLPRTIQHHCSGACGKEQTFERYWEQSGALLYRSADDGWGRTAGYQCRNCKTKKQLYMYVWNQHGFWKVGQIPELQESIDPKLKRALGNSLALYLKAVRSRSFGFGIGAVSYLRRIVEDQTAALMVLLKDEKWDSWSETERSEYETAHGTYQYSQKIEYAAEKILPSTVFANGRDSFTALHDVTSSGLHGKSEEECILIFDRCNLIFTRTFQMLYEHKREREEFAAQLLALKR